MDTRAQASKAVWNTWLELWLRDDAWDGSHKDRSDHENQVLEEVLKHPKANYDPDHALVRVPAGCGMAARAADAVALL